MIVYFKIESDSVLGNYPLGESAYPTEDSRPILLPISAGIQQCLVRQLKLSFNTPSILIILSLIMSSCAHQIDSPTGVSSSELLSKIKHSDAPTIIDVRTGWEYQKGHVPNALHIPFLSTFFRHDEIPAPYDKPVIVYCEHGPRAWIARFALKRAGFEKVFYLNGHMSDWRKAGLPIEKQTEKQ